MKFTTLLKSLIVEESRFKVLYDSFTKPRVDSKGEKHKAKLSKEEYFQLVQADPTTKLNNVNLENLRPEDFETVKAGKYVPWLIKSFLKPVTEVGPEHPMYEKEVRQMKERFIEDLYKVTDDLKKYERFKSRLPLELRQIDTITPQELYNAVKDFDLTMATTSKSERKTAKVHPGAELGYDGDEWRVVVIKDKGPIGKEAACFYGGHHKETRWCTSAPGLTWFDRYIKDGPLYVIYRPNDKNVRQDTGLPIERYQFHFPSNQFMDKDDQQQDLVRLLNGPMAEIKNYFKPEFAKGLTLDDGTSFKIESFTQGAVGKFLALYGANEVFQSLPDSITTIQIYNREKIDVTVRLPENINRFKDLKMMMLDNCVENIPESLCECKEIKFLAFPNSNQKLVLPECLADLPKIILINVKNSPNIVVPDAIKKRTESMGGIGSGLYDFVDKQPGRNNN